MAPPDTSGSLVPLADRLRWTMYFRLALVAMVLALAALPLHTAPGSERELALGAVPYLIATLGIWPLFRGGRRLARAVLGWGLLADGVYLAWAAHWSGGLGGPITAVVMVHVAGVTLLSAFRSGLKVALWHSLLAVSLLSAEQSALLQMPRGSAVPTTPRLTEHLLLLWTTTLAVATFAAANERELRRRRHDVEVLRRLALALESTDDVGELMRVLANLGRDEFLAARAVVVLHHGAIVGTRDLPRGHELLVCADDGTAAATTGGTGVRRMVLERPLPPASLLQQAVTSRKSLLAPRPAPEDGAWLRAYTDQTRNPENLAVIPMTAGADVTGALVLEYGRSTRTGRRGRLESRILSTAQQAAAHAALAIGRASMIAVLRTAADSDGLTGLANRRRFDEALRTELDSARAAASPLAVALLDLDHFKRLNDSLGHLVGDEVLRSVAAAVRGVCRTQDLPARYGGEEIVVILPGVDVREAAVLGERLRTAIAGTQIAGEPDVPVTASIGVAVYPSHATDGDALLAAADAALYRAKAAGRNRVCLPGHETTFPATGSWSSPAA